MDPMVLMMPNAMFQPDEEPEVLERVDPKPSGPIVARDQTKITISKTRTIAEDP